MVVVYGWWSPIRFEVEFSDRVFLSPWFGEPVVCTADSRGLRHFRGFRDFHESSTQPLVCRERGNHALVIVL